MLAGGWSLAAGLAGVQAPAGTREVEIWLQARRLAVGHGHLTRASSSRVGVDEQCISLEVVSRLLGGPKYLEQHGTILEAIKLGSGPGASLRVQRRGVISTRLHWTGTQQYIPLADFARALGADAIADGPGRVRLVPRRGRGNEASEVPILAPNK